jgi:cytochrome c
VKYKGQNVIDQLADKVIAGGMGVWGEHAMSAHPAISKADAKQMVSYIMSLSEPKASNKIALKGELALVKPEGQKSTKGVFVVRATYVDKGNKKIAPVQSEKWVFLRAPQLDVEKADVTKGILQLITPGRSTNMVGGQNPHLGYKGLDLTGISTIEIAASAQARANAAGGVIEIHLDSPSGPVIGQTNAIEVSAQGGFGPPPSATPGKGAPLGTPVANAAPAVAPAGAPAAAPAQQAPRRMNGPAIQKVAIKATSGEHDVYFVAVNPKAAEQQIVVQIQGIEMKK